MLRQLLDLSTAHLSISTRTWLDAQGVIAAACRKSGDPIPTIPLGSTAWGWFVHADETSNRNPQLTQKILERRDELNNGFGLDPARDGLRREAIQRLDNDLAALTASRPNDIPADLWACMSRAIAEGCDYLHFDSDGFILDGLPTYVDGTDELAKAA